MNNSEKAIDHRGAAPGIAVLAETHATETEAIKLASELSLPFISPNDDRARFEFVLQAGAKGLTLVPTDRATGGGIRIDFITGPTAFRRIAAGSTRQPLAKAVGLRQGRPFVIDATAGLGRDSFLLACLGCRVCAVERSTILAAMLHDAVRRASRASERALTEIAKRITVVSGDSKSFLANLSSNDCPDVIYLDPMYTSRASSALAKKEMRILRALVGGDEDAGELLQIARSKAKNRVVVKRHLRAAPLADGVCYTYAGRSVRYDVYPTIPGKNA